MRALGALLVVAALAPSSARAYRTAADDLGLDVPMSRGEHTVQILVYLEDGADAALGEAELAAALEAAVAAWTLPCAPVEVVLLGTSTRPPSDLDGLSTVVVVTSGWEALGHPASQAAVTTLVFSDLPDSLRMTDADLYLNADTIDWRAPGAPDLRAVMVHELGHLLFGVSHPCTLDTADGTGAPLCTPEHRETSLMHPEYLAGAWVPRADDVAAACALDVRRPCDSVACAPDEYCLDGLCRVADVCSDGTACADGACAIAGPGVGMCTSRDGIGAPCVSGADCGTRLCLTVPRAGQRYCTRVCGSRADCASAEDCRLVDGAFVCGPPAPAGCTAAPRRAAPGGAALLLVFIASCALRRRRAADPRTCI